MEITTRPFRTVTRVKTRRPPRACAGCGTPAPGRYCPACAKTTGTTRRAKAAGYRHPAYQARRAQILADNPTCWICGQPATPTDPMTADHLEPIARAHAPGFLSAPV